MVGISPGSDLAAQPFRQRRQPKSFDFHLLSLHLRPKQIVSCVGLYFGMVYNIHIKIGLRSIGIVKQSSREVTFLLSSYCIKFSWKILIIQIIIVSGVHLNLSSK
jgi:hypothetical protein